MSGSPCAVKDPPEIDSEALGVFTDVVFRDLEGPVAARLLTESGRPKGDPWTCSWSIDGSLPGHLNEAAGRAATGARALFVVPCALRNGGRATADNIAATAVLIVDLDEGDIDAKRWFLATALGRPALTVESGGETSTGARKLHLYWRLTEPARGGDLERVARVREQLALKGGGDRALKSITQPIRAPGSLHFKHAPRLVRIVDQSDHEIDLSEAERIADEMDPRFTKVRGEAGKGSKADLSITELMQKQVRAEGLDGVTRYEALSRLIGHWVRRVRIGEITLEDAWVFATNHNQSFIEPPWPEYKLRAEFDAIRRLDGKTNPEQPRFESRREISPTPGSEDALAAELVDRFGENWRSLPMAGSWRYWSGDVWRRDEVNGVINLARGICGEAAARCDKLPEACKLASAKTIQAVVKLAATDPRITASPNAFDDHPMILGVPGALVDLNTGEIKPPRRDLLLSRLAGASPKGSAPRWTSFIEEVTGGDRALAEYLQRVAGYCLTGSTEAQAFFFLHGAGANGKSVFLDTIARALGDYATTAPFETFAASRHASHPTDLAGLQGARLVLVTETDRDRDWAESRIKTITGGDTISARFMRGDFFEFRPTFKLIVAGNHRPGVKTFGEAMRRRMHLVPFDVTIPPERRDPKLQEELTCELGGILSWMIAGCAAWRERGLDPPQSVTAAATQYFEDEDLVGQWIAERCRTGEGETATAQELYDSWTAFAEAGGHAAGTRKALGYELKTRGFHPLRSSRCRGWRGITLNSSRPGPA